MANSPSIAVPLVRQRLALACVFFIHGALFASWAGRIPQLQERLGLSDGQLGISMFCLAMGALVSMPAAGLVSVRFGTSTTTVASSLAFCLALAAIPLGSTWLLFSALLFAFGFAQGSMDVCMNAHAVHVERAYARQIMASFHGMFSLGAMAGAGVSALMCALGWAPTHHFWLVAGIFAIGVAILNPFLHDETSRQPADAPLGFVLPDKHLVVLSLVAFCSFIGEGSISDWSAVYLNHELHSSAAMAASGFSFFCLSMAVFRFAGDWVVNKLGAVPVLMAGSVIASSGIAVGLLIPDPRVVLAFYVLAGIGFSCMVPVAFSAAGKNKWVAPGIAIAGVATVGYFGFIIAPPIIGLLADRFTLRAALWLPVALTLFVFVLAKHAVPES